MLIHFQFLLLPYCIPSRFHLKDFSYFFYALSKVDRIPLLEETHETAVAVLKSTREVVRLQVLRKSESSAPLPCVPAGIEVSTEIRSPNQQHSDPIDYRREIMYQRDNPVKTSSTVRSVVIDIICFLSKICITRYLSDIIMLVLFYTMQI